MTEDAKPFKHGTKVKFTGVRPYWFTDMIENGKKLTVGNIYTINEEQVFSSHSVCSLLETGDLDYCGGWFEAV